MSLLALVASPAAAQDPDPYGATTTTAPIDFFPTCHYTLDASAPGTAASLTVTNVPFGSTVRVLVGGVEAGRATAPLAAQAASAGVLFGGAALPAQAATTTLVIPFTVPDLPPGVYQVTAVGADFTLTCDQETIEVLGGGGSDGGADSGTDGGKDSGGLGSLPRTGIYVGLLLASALILLLVGRALTEASRRKREEAERRARGEARRAAREAELASRAQE